MGRIAWKLNVALLLLMVIAAGCSRSGSQFLGKWVNTRDARDTMEITRNGEQFLIQVGSNRIGAAYKDGGLEVSGMMGSVKITYVKDSDTLIAPGLFAQSEYKRAK